MTGGVMAFITAILRARGVANTASDGSVRAIPGHNIPMALVGTFILAFVWWFGFNAGSTLAGSDLRIGASRRYDAGWGGGDSPRWCTCGSSTRQARSVNARERDTRGLVAITAPCDS